ncbi:hypothetical protein AAG906_018373 [Vitis piasezkii]
MVESKMIATIVSSKVSMVTNHICGNISTFTSYTTIKEENKQMFMDDSRFSPMIGKWKFLLMLTFGKMLALNDVLHVRIFTGTWCQYLLGKA